jgi:uncharacterized protein YegP (UPF0339 family)
MRIEIFSARNLIGRKRWYFRVRAANGSIIAHSEGYSRRFVAVSTAHSLKAGLANAEIPAFRDEGDVL